MNATVTDTIRYIGVDDLDIDLFESQYVVPEGMSYNSYLILDEKVAIMDTVDARKASEWQENLQNALGGRTPDYLVCHHLEPDHAALVGETMLRYPSLTLVTSAKAATMLPNFFAGVDMQGRIMQVKEGDTLQLGAHTLHFVDAPMVHWPEVLMSYESSEKVLFAADGFGKFGALANETDDWACEARRYYFNICGKYGFAVQAVLKKAAALDIETICPLHGPVLKGEPMAEAIRLYDIWSRYEAESEGVMVAYASIHGGTAMAAKKVADILSQKGVKVVLTDLCRSDLAEAVEDAFRYSRLVCCAASYDATVFPPMHDFLWHLQIKAYQNRRIALLENGSWAPSAAKAMKALIEPMKNITLVEPIVTIRSRMKDSDMAAIEQMCEAILG